MSNLASDLVFKEMFGKKENIIFLEMLIEELKGKPKGFYQNKVRLLNGTPLTKTTLKNKSLTSDILASIPGEIINIEMYHTLTKNNFTKSKVYLSRIYGTALPIGKPYNEQVKVSQYNICLHVKLAYIKDFKTEYLFKEKWQNTIIAEDIEGTIFNLDKLKANCYDVGISDRLDKIFTMMKTENIAELTKIVKGDKELMKLKDRIRKFIYEDDLRQFKNIQDKWKEEAFDYGMNKGLRQGRRKGLAIGRAEGRAKGIAEGRAEGRAENQKSMLYNMQKLNIDMTTMSKISGLTKEQIMEILK